MNLFYFALCFLAIFLSNVFAIRSLDDFQNMQKRVSGQKQQNKVSTAGFPNNNFQQQRGYQPVQQPQKLNRQVVMPNNRRQMQRKPFNDRRQRILDNNNNKNKIVQKKE
jgi:hypothetical protein